MANGTDALPSQSKADDEGVKVTFGKNALGKFGPWILAALIGGGGGSGLWTIFTIPDRLAKVERQMKSMKRDLREIKKALKIPITHEREDEE